MNEMNGSKSPSFLDGSGISTPVMTENAASPSPNNREDSGKKPILQRASSRNSTSEAINSVDQRKEGGAGATRSRKSLERSSDGVTKLDSNSAKEIRAGDEELSPKSIPERPKTNSITEGIGRVGRKDRDDSENQPFSVDEDPRSSSIVRSGTFADGTNFVSATSSEADASIKTRRKSMSLSKQGDHKVKT